MNSFKIKEILKPFTKKDITRNSIDDYLVVAYPYGIMEPITEKSMEQIDSKIENVLQNDNIPKNFYIHYDACTRRCSGCHYGITIEKNSNAIVNQLLSQIKLFENKTTKISEANIFFGGGSPSLMNSKQVELLYKTLQETFNIQSINECTLEIHPETIHVKENPRKYLEELSKIGINRISLGLQDSDDKVLKKWSRGHTIEDTLKLYQISKDNNFTINLDILWGMPNQTLKKLEKTLDLAYKLEPDVITTYHYWLRPDTNDYYKFQRNELQLSDEIIEMRKLILLKAKENKYIQKNGDWFEKEKPSTKYLSAKWGSMDSALIAFGQATYSWFFSGLENNQFLWTSIPENIKDSIVKPSNKYNQAIKNRKYPYIGHLTLDEELTIRRHAMFNLKANTLTKEKITYFLEQTKGNELQTLINNYIEANLLQWKNNILTYTEAGDIIPDQIAASFTTNELLEKMIGIPNNPKIQRYTWFPNPEKIKTLKNMILEKKYLL